LSIIASLTSRSRFGGGGIGKRQDGGAAALENFQKFLDRKAALFEDIRERALRNFGVHRNHSPPDFVVDSFFKRDMCPFGEAARSLRVSEL
jgi:hypothetical protein